MVMNEQLVELYNSVDDKGLKDRTFNKIYKQNYKMICQEINKFNIKNSEILFEEFNQHAMLTLFKIIPKYNKDSNASFLTFYKNALINTFKTLYNKQKELDKEVCIGTEYLNYYVDKEEILDYDSVDEKLFQEQNKCILNKYLDKIKFYNSRSKEIYYCKNGINDGIFKTYQEVADILGIKNRQNVQNICRDYNKKLKMLIDADIEIGRLSKEELF